MIVADDRYILLALERGAARDIALLALHAQVRAHKRLGHIMALNDERVWREVRKAIKAGEVPHVVVRCVRCGVEAWFLDWVVLAEVGTQMVLSTLTARSPEGSRPPEGFAKPCTGDEYARTMHMLLVG